MSNGRAGADCCADKICPAVAIHTRTAARSNLPRNDGNVSTIRIRATARLFWKKSKRHSIVSSEYLASRARNQSAAAVYLHAESA